jgi:hypothetical protein
MLTDHEITGVSLRCNMPAYDEMITRHVVLHRALLLQRSDRRRAAVSYSVLLMSLSWSRRDTARSEHHLYSNLLKLGTRSSITTIRTAAATA